MKTFKELREQTSTGADNWHRQNAAAGFDARANQILSGMLVNVAKDSQRQRQNRQVAQNELSQREAIRNKAFIGDRKLIDYDPISGSRFYGDDEAVRSHNLYKQRLRSAEIASKWREENERNLDLNRQDWYASQPQNMTPEERFQGGLDARQKSLDYQAQQNTKRELEDIKRELERLTQKSPMELPPAYLEPMWKKLNQ